MKKKNNDKCYKLMQFFGGFYFGLGMMMILIFLWINSMFGVLFAMLLVMCGVSLFHEIRFAKLEGNFLTKKQLFRKKLYQKRGKF